MTRIATLLASIALISSAGFALAQDENAGSMEGMDHSSMDMSNMPEHMQAMMGAMDTMMQNMPMESSGDVDADFLLMMIPHHQSAIDMAQVELEQGDDEETKAMAQRLIDAQQKEIEEMRPCWNAWAWKPRRSEAGRGAA